MAFWKNKHGLDLSSQQIKPETVPGEPEKLPAYRICSQCGVFVAADKVQTVRGSSSATISLFTQYYCSAHRVPYDRFKLDGYGEATFYKEFEVLDNGAPLGYVPSAIYGKKDKK